MACSALHSRVSASPEFAINTRNINSLFSWQNMSLATSEVYWHGGKGGPGEL